MLANVPLLAGVIANPPESEDKGGRAVHGYWGPRTANTNWCEADYAVTHYIAEFWNTISSFAILLHGAYGYYKLSWAELRYHVAFAMFAVVGIGSALFHGTLWRSMQMMDELPMMWGNCIFCYCLWCMEFVPGRSTLAAAVGFVTMTVAATAAVVFLDDDDQTVFLLSYGSGLLYITYAGVRLDGKYGPKTGGTVPLMELALLFYMGGLLVWLVDRTWCSQVQSLQLHSVWHVCASTGTYLSVLHWVWLRELFLERKPGFAGRLPAPIVTPGEKV